VQQPRGLFTRSWLFAAVYALAALPFVFRSWHYGYDPTDDGLVLGYAWRIWNGEIPHRDFLFTRPPLSPLIHSLWFMFPRDVPILGARAAYYAQMAVTGLLPALWAFSRGHVRRTAPTLALLVICFAFALHFFPPMPWYTVDGIDLSMLGVVLLLCSLDQDASPARRMTLSAAAGALFMAAALAKQPFAAMVVFLVAILAATSWKQAVAACAGVAGVLAAMSLYLWTHGALRDFVEQIASEATAGTLRRAGIALYLHHLAVFPISPLLGAGLALRGPRARGIEGAAWFLAPYLFLVGLGFAYLTNHAQFMAFQLFWFGAGLCAAALYEVWTRPSPRTREWAVFSCAVLSVAWLSSLSRGWTFPLLGMASFGPLIAKSVEGGDAGGGRWIRWAPPLLATALVMVIAVDRHTQPPYHGPGVSMEYDLATVYPAFGRMYSTRDVFERTKELSDLSRWASTSMSNPILVMPDFPLFYFLENRTNPASLDWWWPPDYRGFESRIISELSAKRPVILLERRSPGDAECSFKYGDDALTGWIASHSTIVKRSPRFCALVIR